VSINKRTETERNHKTLILGIGNPILRDDRVGHLLVRILRSRFSGSDIEFQETSLAGLNLAEFLAGFDSAIIIDAIQSGGVPGEVYCLQPQSFGSQKANQNDQHRTGLLQALELGKSLGWPMPEDVNIVAIEAGDATSFGEDLTPPVEKAIPVALDKILHLLESRQEQPDEARRLPKVI
jgi:hydrogenase maturation protease